MRCGGAAFAAVDHRLCCMVTVREGQAVDTVVKPTKAGGDANGPVTPGFRMMHRLIAGAIVVMLVLAAGCSSNSRSIGGALLPTVILSNPQVAQILASSCFDCHSEERTAAWYVKFAPSYWFSRSARKNLNFTDWNDYDARRKTEAIEAIGRVVNRGEMPPWDYTVFHPAAELSNHQKDLVAEWAAHNMEVLPAH
jgi:hypothetical protein